MPLISGELLENVLNRINQGEKIACLVIDTERDMRDSTGGDDRKFSKRLQMIRHHQQNVIAFLSRHNCPVILIEFTRPTPLPEPGITTITLLRALLPVENRLAIRKTKPNAFTDTQLHNWLQERHINSLVIMGENPDLCVGHTATGGGVKGVFGPSTGQGAIQLGYDVLTCQYLLTGNKLTWYTLPNVYVFTEVGGMHVSWCNLREALSKNH